MKRAFRVVGLLCVPMASGCFLQALDPSLTSGGGAAPTDAGLTTSTKTPQIEFDGGFTYDVCSVTTSQANSILEKYCARCHSGRDPGAHQGQPPFDFLFDFERLKTQGSSVADLRDPNQKMKFVVPGDPDNSRIYFRVSKGEMPPRDVVGLPSNPKPTVSDISMLREWITSCMGGAAPPVIPPPAAPPAPPGGAPPPPAPAPAPPPAPPPGGGETAAKLVLSSPDLDEGGVMPLAHSLPMNRSPELSWTAGPPNTESYAVALTAVNGNIVLWAIWDIPATERGLPEAIARTTATPANPRGSRQRNYQNGMGQVNGTGYIGPAANMMAAGRNYRFDVWALTVPTLPLGAGGGANLDTAAIVDLIKARAIPGTVGSLTVTGNPGN